MDQAHSLCTQWWILPISIKSSSCLGKSLFFIILCYYKWVCQVCATEGEGTCSDIFFKSFYHFQTLCVEWVSKTGVSRCSFLCTGVFCPLSILNLIMLSRLICKFLSEQPVCPHANRWCWFISGLYKYAHGCLGTINNAKTVRMSMWAVKLCTSTYQDQIWFSFQS